MTSPNSEEALWQRLSRSLFGASTTTDESLFTYRVMSEIRALNEAFEDLAWPRFLRWAIPLLGVGVASLVLASRIPASFVSMDNVLLQRQAASNDPLSPILEGLR